MYVAARTTMYFTASVCMLYTNCGLYNPWIMLLKAWIRALYNNPWIAQNERHIPQNVQFMDVVESEDPR